MIFPFLIHSAHCSTEHFPVITEKGIKDNLSKETGWDRVKRMYSSDAFGVSPEINYVLKTGTYTVCFAGFLGGFQGMKTAKEEFMRRNKSAQFDSQYLAKRSLTDAMTMGFIKGGSASLVKYGSFSLLYLLSIMTIANYRNKVSVWEHAATAAVLGGFSRANYGLRGFAIAGALGGVIGLLAGGIITIAMGAGGMTMDEFRCWLQEEHYTRLHHQSLKESKKTS